ncbi:MAG: DUF1573 domain-containing protein [Planctomycetota bacterium]|nr:DUF1573 domain-containing protein [Planctomycetaceae bacterium]MDQ3330897.1 DUF1573 domain-containing protein [Planctomycetota bacterium]
MSHAWNAGKPRFGLFGNGSVLFGTLAGLAAVLVILAVAIYKFGSASNALLYLRGQYVFIEPAVAHVNLSAARDTIIVPFDFKNLSQRSVTISGARETCACTLAQGLPLIVPARSSRQVIVEINPAAAPPELVETIVFYMDAEESRTELPVRIVGR